MYSTCPSAKPQAFYWNTIFIVQKTTYCKKSKIVICFFKQIIATHLWVQRHVKFPFYSLLFLAWREKVIFFVYLQILSRG